MDEIDLKLELIDEAYEEVVRRKLAERPSTNELLLRKAAEMLRGDYTLEVVRDAIPIYEFGKAGAVHHIENHSPIYRITSYDRYRDLTEIIEVGEEINTVPEFQEIFRRYHGG